MSYPNIGTPVSSSRKWFFISGFALFLAAALGGAGYNAYLHYKKNAPLDQKSTAHSRSPVQVNCATTSPCTLARNEKGSTPEGKSVCFEPDFWTNLPKLGYKTSYKGKLGPEGDAKVTADTFWFDPQTEIAIPRYWFVPEGSTTC